MHNYELEERQERAAEEHQHLVDALHETIDDIMEATAEIPSIIEVLDELSFHFTEKQIACALDEINNIYEEKKEQIEESWAEKWKTD
jgi:hypothetical protein